MKFERVGRLDFVYGARTLLADNWLYGQARGLMFVFFGKSYFGSMTHPQNGRYHQIASSMPAFALAELAIADQKFTVFNDATAVPSDRAREKQR